MFLDMSVFKEPKQKAEKDWVQGLNWSKQVGFFNPFLFFHMDFSPALFLAGVGDAVKCLGYAWVTW